MLHEPRQRFGLAAACTTAALYALSALRADHVLATAIYLTLCLGFVTLPAFTVLDRAAAFEHRHLLGGVLAGWLMFIGWNVLSVLASPTSSDVIGLVFGACIGSLASIVALHVMRKPRVPATI